MLEAFLTARGYRIAPVTLDAWDWMFAGVYDDARKRGVPRCSRSRQLLSCVFGCGIRVFGKFSKDLLGYEPKQILLLHANQLEASTSTNFSNCSASAATVSSRSEDALTDDAYSMPDTYIGEEGRGWLDHWALSRGKPVLGFPGRSSVHLGSLKGLAKSAPNRSYIFPGMNFPQIVQLRRVCRFSVCGRCALVFFSRRRARRTLRVRGRVRIVR